MELRLTILALTGWLGPATAPAAAPGFHVPANPAFSILDSMTASVRFTTRKCLEPAPHGLRATSTFVDPEGRPALWHEFGAVEGVGWAANAVGGAIHLIRYARRLNEPAIEKNGLAVLEHAVYDGFVDPDTGFLRGYYDLRNRQHYLNYLHEERNDHWFCAGSAARVALQYLEAADLCADTRLGEDSRACGLRLARWLRDHVELAPNGWFPRRSRVDGKPYPFRAFGANPDECFASSGDGLHLLWLYAEMARRGHEGYRGGIERPLRAFLDAGGFFGSLNHDTYDPHENVCYAVAFRVLRRLAAWELCTDPAAVRKFAYERCLHGLEPFEMHEDRNGVATRGLLYMEKSWDTAYLWENAEAALAWVEAALDTGRGEYRDKGLTILRAAARHHYGPHGFLTEGVDWNNHNGQWREVDGRKISIHVEGARYGAVNYTQPFLNNLHITEPTLLYLEHFARRSAEGDRERIEDHEGNLLGYRRRAAEPLPAKGGGHAR